MEKVPKEEIDTFAIYLPHHAVVRDNETTKVRIVLDASCKGSNNTSLNNLLYVGPKLQQDLRNLIMRWRMREICYTSDIKKMYRMVLVKKEDADCQRILWRKHFTDEVEDYRMLRVTFGTASAPYLAIKALKQLSQDENDTFPIGAEILKEDFYVDDCLSGDHTLEGAIKGSLQLRQLLEKGGFVLQKWASNSKEFLEKIPRSLRSSSVEKGITSESTIKTLGLTWNMTTDSFRYHTKLPLKPTCITKRTILADVQSLFDPLGWISPAIIMAKMLIQNIWKQRLDWDEIVEQKEEEEWLKLRESFGNMNKIQINRWIYTNQDTSKITLHGYCDASNKGYCAVVYYRVETHTIKTGIIASRTKLAPLKPISLPRLELSGAVLLSKLLKQVRDAMRLKESQTFAWTDSTIVLSWLMGDPNRWQIFVSNRVVEILENVSITQWFHVKSKENPADIGSRGMNLNNLINNKLWWEGLEWLKHKNIIYSKPNIPTTDLEMKKVKVNAQLEKNIPMLISEEFDTLQELLKTIIYSLRFLNSKKSPENINKEITTDEVENALTKCIRIAQDQEFSKEIEALQKQRNVARESSLRNLNPYLDEKRLIRVGGRLRNANLSHDQKHPIILDTSDTELEILTPGHFLIGETPVSIPNPNLQDVSLSKLSRWQHVQRLVGNFWHKWQNEYLTRLQTRSKWVKTQKEYEIGDIVLLKEDQMPPGKWARYFNEFVNVH
ncbi:uncharacterized protein LOC113507491 [Trichoplusia ni]|uniref:Uncharacterized protein LOC113507491 n=1 Tax=Trichoplusia ni TaxID=7111 RepID=A0A7E5X0Z2_TRINI|nr:uncharacterized protein LOC113507491 [Trichoplusia ni]